MKEYSFVSWSFLNDESGMGSTPMYPSGGTPEGEAEESQAQAAPVTHGRSARATYEVAA